MTADAVAGYVKVRKSAQPSPIHRTRGRRGDNTISREAFDELTARRMSEEAWRMQMRGHAHDAGFHLRYHTHRSDRSDAGWLDEVIWHAGTARLLFYEVKRQSKVLTVAQVGWADSLARTRDRGCPLIEVYAPVRPLDVQGWIATVFRGTGYRSDHEPLHQWCLYQGCERCNTERRRATL